MRLVTRACLTQEQQPPENFAWVDYFLVQDLPGYQGMLDTGTATQTSRGRVGTVGLLLAVPGAAGLLLVVPGAAAHNVLRLWPEVVPMENDSGLGLSERIKSLSHPHTHVAPGTTIILPGRASLALHYHCELLS